MSRHYVNGLFQNELPTPVLVEGQSKLGAWFSFLFSRNDRLCPDHPLPAVKTSLGSLDRHAVLIVWFGHSSIGSCLLLASASRCSSMLKGSIRHGEKMWMAGNKIYRCSSPHGLCGGTHRNASLLHELSALTSVASLGLTHRKRDPNRTLLAVFRRMISSLQTCIHSYARRFQFLTKRDFLKKHIPICLGDFYNISF